MNQENSVSVGSVELSFKQEEQQGILVCQVSGQLETDNSPGFLNEVKSNLGLPGINTLVMDLTGLTYVSSTGIGSFTTLLIECKNREISLVLKHMNEKVKSVFDLLGFSSFFTME